MKLWQVNVYTCTCTYRLSLLCSETQHIVCWKRERLMPFLLLADNFTLPHSYYRHESVGVYTVTMLFHIWHLCTILVLWYTLHGTVSRILYFNHALAKDCTQYFTGEWFKSACFCCTQLMETCTQSVSHMTIMLVVHCGTLCGTVVYSFVLKIAIAKTTLI